MTTANREQCLTAERVRAALATVRYPGLTRDRVSFGMVEAVSVCNERVKLRLAVRSRDEGMAAALGWRRA